MTATFSISPRGRQGSKKIDISADIHAENGKIFRIEACKGRGECHIYIEEDEKLQEGEHDVVINEESRRDETDNGNRTIMQIRKVFKPITPALEGFRRPK